LSLAGGDMNKTRHLAISIVLSLLIFVTGTAGYMIIEGWRFLDALYMTVITISTVGYREVNQVGDTGRLFTIFLVLIGVGFTFYVMAAVVQFMVEGRVRIIMGRRRLDKQINRLKNHYIVCGYGRIGRVLCRNLQRTPYDLVVIDKNPDGTMLFNPSFEVAFSLEDTVIAVGEEENLQKLEKILNP
jgi:voltage-gated potassium channel